MKNSIQSIGIVSLFVCLLVAPVTGQNWIQGTPAPGATAATYTVSTGFTSMVMSVPGAGHVTFNGFDINGGVDLNPRFGAALDTTYARASNLFGTQHGGHVLTILAGPVFYPVERGKNRMFVHALVGMGIVDGVAPSSFENYSSGWVRGTSYAFGGGAEHFLRGPLSVRVSGDYMRTPFINYSRSVQPQNDFRVTAGMVLALPRIGGLGR